MYAMSSVAQPFFPHFSIEINLYNSDSKIARYLWFYTFNHIHLKCFVQITSTNGKSTQKSFFKRFLISITTEEICFTFIKCINSH